MVKTSATLVREYSCGCELHEQGERCWTIYCPYHKETNRTPKRVKLEKE